MKFNILSKLCSFFRAESIVAVADVYASECATKVTTISDEIQFESVKDADEFLSKLQGRYNL